MRLLLLAGLVCCGTGMPGAGRVAAAAPVAGDAAHGPVVLSGAATGRWSVRARPVRRLQQQGGTPVRPPRTQRLRPGCGGRSRPAPSSRPTGEGIVSLTMSAPGTSWASSTNTSAAVDVAVDRGPTQQVVLFEGRRPALYEGYLGRLSTGPHCVTVHVDPGRSSDLAPPVVKVFGIDLGVVPRSAPAYLALTHAPVLYGRSSSAERDAQLLTDVTESRDADKRHIDLAYTVIWSREDVGDGTVPAYEWGLWGRMTDIETVLREVVTPSGRIVSAQYLSCGCEKYPTYPDAVPAPPINSEYDAPYPAGGTPRPMGRHIVLRDATGNNDVSPYGETNYRFQQVPVRGPLPGQMREVIMDQHPWTYRISNEDVARTTVESSDPGSPLAGGYPQYLIVDLDVDAVATKSIAVGVQLSGDSTWWTDDYAQTTGVPTTFPFYNGGHARTVIKLPVDWHSKRLSALRLVLNAAPGGATPRLKGKPAIQLIEVTQDYRVRVLRNPPLQVMTGTQVLPGIPF